MSPNHNEREQKKKGTKRTTKTTQNNEQNGNRNITINNYFKCKCTKCSKQKTQSS